MEADLEYQENTTLTFEWTLRGLKNLFDSSKGEAKSKVTKSLKFGGGRWQILFYANAGSSKEGQEGAFISLYLSCEPTTEEKESSDGKWVREGVFKFTFEIRNLGKTVLYNLKEAHNHSFTHQTANWGWAQFARRDHMYYHSNAVKMQDAFIIICSITSPPSFPLDPPPIPRLSVPKDLLDTVGALLNDPLYSDVEFILPKRGQAKNAKKIWAARRLLQRVEYFDAMFSSGFSESTNGQMALMFNHDDKLRLEYGSSQTASVSRRFEDSDDEDSDEGHGDADLSSTEFTSDVASSIASEELDAGPAHQEEDVQTTTAHSSSPNSNQRGLDDACVPGPQKLGVVVRDAAYNTYYAILYYIYTDAIVFAPLSSSFSSSHKQSESPGAASTENVHSLSMSDAQGNAPSKKVGPQPDVPLSRKEWIKEWINKNKGKPAPCSAKSVYRLADRLNLSDLKDCAFRHIVKSLTVENIGFEVFSPFSAAYDEVRKVEIEYFLKHWGEIRASDSIREVWKEIRNGRHPGFEEVWPIIALNLEFNPHTSESGTSDASSGV